MPLNLSMDWCPVRISREDEKSVVPRRRAERRIRSAWPDPTTFGLPVRLTATDISA